MWWIMGVGAFRNNYKEHVDKIQGDWKHGWEVGMAGVGCVVGVKCRQLC